jgi:hypothetical protein
MVGRIVLFDLADVALPGRELQLDHLQVPVEELANRGAGAGVPVLVDLRQQPGPRLLGFPAGVDGLAEVVVLPVMGSTPAYT